MMIWMRQQQAAFLVFLGLLQGKAAAQEGRCSLSMPETGECAWDNAGQSSNNGTIRGMGNEELVPMGISVSLNQSHPAPAPVGPLNYTIPSSSIRADDNRIEPIRARLRASREDNARIIESSWGEDQAVGEGVSATQIRRVVEQTDKYMRHAVFKKKEFHQVRKHCINHHPACSHWTVQGECRSNKNYMQLKCAPACRTCDMLDVQKRCPVDPSVSNAWGQGDLNKLFERIATDPFYTEHHGPVQVLSRPHMSRKERTRLSGHSQHIQEDGPWLVSMDNLLTPNECNRLIELGVEEGYEPSAEVGSPREDGTRERLRSRGRTSYNAWCGQTCEQDETAQRVLRRLQNLTGIPQENIEHLQLLRYDKGQQYGNHYDLSLYERHRPQGGRLLTVFLYLNDVEDGGETEFTALKHPLLVTPKRGRALIWPNVLDQDPDSVDRRTKHRALPVREGIKYGVNAWFHQRDFRTPHSQGCTA